MDKPPISLYYPSYVIEYAVIDSSIEFISSKTLSVNGKWLGAVPKLAICKDIKTKQFHLSHCNENWESITSVQEASDIKTIKEIAENRYIGIKKKWRVSNYTRSSAERIFEKLENENRCSFCKKSIYDNTFASIIGEKDPKICNVCVQNFHKDLQDIEKNGF